MQNVENVSIVLSDYVRYRIDLRGFDPPKIEEILRYSAERYFDTVTGRMIAVGRHDDRLVMVPYEEKEGTITPVTIHVTTRQQITFRLKTGRFAYE